MADLFETVVHGEQAVEKAASDVQAVLDLLIGARSCVLTFYNNTRQTWELTGTSHDHGAFSTPPPGVVPPQQEALFGSHSTGFATGCQGSATYGLSNGVTITLRWDNPFVGGNSSAVGLDGPNHNQFRATNNTGAGNEKAQIRYDVYDIEMHGVPVYGAILDKWAALGWGISPLGFPRGDEVDGSVGGGRLREFDSGTICWHPANPRRDAFGVWGAIGGEWKNLGGVAYGYPVTDETGAPDGRGRFNHFRAYHLPGPPDGSIYWTPQTGAQPVYGAIRDKWAALGWEKSPLGYPTAPEADAPGGRIQRFERGSLFWNRSNGSVTPQ